MIKIDGRFGTEDNGIKIVDNRTFYITIKGVTTTHYIEKGVVTALDVVECDTSFRGDTTYKRTNYRTPFGVLVREYHAHGAALERVSITWSLVTLDELEETALRIKELSEELDSLMEKTRVEINRVDSTDGDHR